MPTYTAQNIPASAVRSTLEPDLAAWLSGPDAPHLGGLQPVHELRALQDRLRPGRLPPVRRVEYLGIGGPHGTVSVPYYHPSRPGPARGAALVYLHGGGWTVGDLDQFETPMRLFSERSGRPGLRRRLPSCPPEHQWPVQIDECEFAVRWLFDHAAGRGVDPTRIALGGDSAGGNLTCVIAPDAARPAGPTLAVQVPLYPETAMPFTTRRASRTGPAVPGRGRRAPVRLEPDAAGVLTTPSRTSRR